MVVLEMDRERAGLWNAALRRRAFQIDIERRQNLAVRVPAERARHRLMIPGEPQPLDSVLARRQRARGLWKAEVAGELRGLAGDEPARRAILLSPVLHRVL